MSTAFLPRLLFAISDADALHVLFFFLRDTERERERGTRESIDRRSVRHPALEKSPSPHFTGRREKEEEEKKENVDAKFFFFPSGGNNKISRSYVCL